MSPSDLTSLGKGCKCFPTVTVPLSCYPGLSGVPCCTHVLDSLGLRERADGELGVSLERESE